MVDITPALRSGRLIQALLFAVTLSIGVGLAALPVATWNAQRTDLDEARERRDGLRSNIDAIERDISGIIGEEGLEVAARCRNFLVEPGEELYAIPGLQGCVTKLMP